MAQQQKRCSLRIDNHRSYKPDIWNVRGHGTVWDFQKSGDLKDIVYQIKIPWHPPSVQFIIIHKKDCDEDSRHFPNVTASRRGWKTGISRRCTNITSESRYWNRRKPHSVARGLPERAFVMYSINVRVDIGGIPPLQEAIWTDFHRREGVCM